MKHLKLFEEFLNEADLKIPARINDPADLVKYFPEYNLDKAKSIWGSNSGIVLTALNGKDYSIRYIFKNMHSKYLQLKLVK